MAKIAINAVKSLKFETLDRKSLSPKTIVVTELLPHSGASTEGKWTQLASNLAQGGILTPGDIFVVCNCASSRCMDYVILYNYDAASAVVSITPAPKHDGLK